MLHGEGWQPATSSSASWQEKHLISLASRVRSALPSRGDSYPGAVLRRLGVHLLGQEGRDPQHPALWQTPQTCTSWYNYQMPHWTFVLGNSLPIIIYALNPLLFFTQMQSIFGILLTSAFPRDATFCVDGGNMMFSFVSSFTKCRWGL